MLLKDKVAIVTGSTKGLGRGIAEAYAREGAKIVIVSRKQDECEAVAAGLSAAYNVETYPVSADLTKLSDIDNLVEKTIQRFGRIDILVNNAGGAITKKSEDLTEEDWDHVIDLDLKSVFFCSQKAGKHMIAQKSGKIINISSVLGLVADKQVLPYCAAKGGVLQMTKALGLEWIRYGINVNAICPGWFITEINRAILEDETTGGKRLKTIPQRRFGQTEDLAGAAILLASDASNYMVGQSIVIDGGLTIE